MTQPAKDARAKAAPVAEDPLAQAGETAPADVASTGRTDAVSAGLVKGSGERHRAQGRTAPRRPSDRRRRRASQGGAGDLRGSAAAAQEGAPRERRPAARMRAAVADAVVREADDSDEFEGTEEAYRTGRRLSGLARSGRARRTDAAGPPRGADSDVARRPVSADRARFRQGKAREGAADARRIQSRRTWLKARAAQEKAGRTAAAASGAAKKGAARTLAAAATSAAGPLAGVLAGVLCFVLAALAVSQIASALFGFWDNEASKASLDGPPPYITHEMVETALECQEDYGHPAGCTIAQIICESGQGDRLSALAERDKNLFGIKWASSFLGCPEVAGKSAWATSEEYGGEVVGVMADFTRFKGHRECIVFRSRVLLANERYAGNPLIQEAVAKHDSDKMAEGLKDAGYATSSSYVDSLKSALDAYGLRRFDNMSLEDFRAGGVSGDAIVAAAESQLGVPYVWGGSTPGAGLDCSGLTQYCYAQVGISIPRYSEDQASEGRRVPLSEAVPGDILWKPGHVAIYAGGDEYIHEPQTGDVCRRARGIAYFTCAIRYR